MSVRTAFAAALKVLRKKRGLTQHALSGAITQSHISQMENGKTSPSLEAIIDLAGAMGLSPVAFMALVSAAQDELTPDEVLELAKKDLHSISLLKVAIPLEAKAKVHPGVVAAAQARKKVQKLKDQGFSQADIARELEMAESTVRRHWHRDT